MKNKLFAIVMALFVIVCICSCNVTRIVTNTSEYTSRGDTAVVIQTKTTETYNAKKNL